LNVIFDGTRREREADGEEKVHRSVAIVIAEGHLKQTEQSKKGKEW
jgi:hypothetical protein